MNSDQFRRYLVKQGCTFEEGKRHTIVRLDGRMSVLPGHGGAKQLGTGLMRLIEKDLGLWCSPQRLFDPPGSREEGPSHELSGRAHS